jgi:hypothetical protein
MSLGSKRGLEPVIGFRCIDEEGIDTKQITRDQAHVLGLADAF